MRSSELESIAEAMQEALHRAYALGRSDALRRVVEMVQSDDLGAKTVPLLSHSPSQPLEAPEPKPGPEPEASTALAAEPAPTTFGDTGQPTSPAVRVGPAQDEGGATAEPPGRNGSRSGTSPGVKKFLLDYLYPLGAKK